MATDTTERPDITEQYQTAGNTSNLAVEADRKGAGDVIIAAGWSLSRAGMALLRLHSEWDSAAKPRRPSQPQIAALAEKLKRQDEAERANRDRENGELERLRDTASKTEPGAPGHFDLLVAIMHQERLHETGALPKPAPPKPGNLMARAQIEAKRWYASELRLLAQSLKSRAVVWQQLEHWLAINRIPPDTVAAALLHWLSPACPMCDGHGLHRVPDQPALSARRCNHCHGTGEVTRPEGSAKVLNYLDDAVQKARTSLKKRLRPENG